MRLFTVAVVVAFGATLVAAQNSPTVSYTNPSSGPVGTVVTITGQYFGAAQGTSTVSFNGTVAAPSSWSDTQIVAAVPTGATTGKVSVTVNGIVSNGGYGPTFTVGTPPNVSYTNPSSGPVGTVVTITGKYFGAAQGTSTVSFNGTVATPSSWSDTQIVAPVPTGATTGKVSVTVNGIVSNGGYGPTFTVGTPPNVSYTNPSSGPVGTVVTITGQYFGATQGTSTVSFNGTAATPSSWSDTQIVAPVPTGATTGKVSVTVNGIVSNGGYGPTFTVVTPPNVSYTNPTSGPVGTVVTITGQYFGATQGTSTVSFNGIVATPSSWSDTQIVAPVPAGAITGKVSVTVNGIVSNGGYGPTFTVIEPPTVTSVQNSSMPVGGKQCVNGNGYGASQASSTLTLNGTAMTSILTWADNQVCFTVPASTATGSATMQVTTAGGASNTASFTLTAAPTISGISPGSGAVGTQVTITGTNFGATQGVSYVMIGGSAPVVSWSDTQIVVTVPQNNPGQQTVRVYIDSAYVTSTFTIPSAPLNISRYQHSGTMLNNGTVLIAGGANCTTAGSCTYLNSAEIYDPAAGTSASTGSMATPRAAPAVLLPNGKVLIAGGSTCDPYGNCFSLSSSEIFDPVSGAYTSAGNMLAARDGHTMTLLADGRVLIAGGESCVPGSSGGPSSENRGEPRFGGARLVSASFTPVIQSITCNAEASAEIYDPQSGVFSFTGSLNSGRYNAAATRLANGQILVIGGSDEFSPLKSAELYNPSTGVFTAIANGLGTPRSSPAATLLNNGLVLISGGSTCEGPTCPTNTAELYDPNANVFRYASGSMNTYRVNHSAVLLTNGQVLLAGGTSSCSGPSACTSDGTTELYDPAADSFSSSQPLTVARSWHSAILLSNGNVLLAGGIASGTTLASVEIYEPPSLAPAGLVSIAVGPSTSSIPVGATQQFVATGTFSDGSTSTLQSASWASSNSAVGMISNTAGNSGFAFGVGLGLATITATVGTLSGSAALSVHPPVQSASFATTSGQMGVSEYAHTATRLTTGQVLISGGMSPSGVLNNAQIYNPANQSFAAIAPMNVARWLHTSTLLNDGTVLIVGGSDLANKEALSSAEIYNPTSGAFTLLPSTLNTARIGHTATLLSNGQVLVVGGYDPKAGLIGAAELYDPGTQTFIPLASTQVPRYQHTATLLQNGQVLIAGGVTGTSATAAYNTAELFDPMSKTFTLVSVPMTTAREAHAAVLLNNGQVLIAGGEDPGAGSLNTAELYDPTSDVFLPVTGTMTTPRMSHAMALLNGDQVLLLGGQPGGSGVTLASAEIYNPSSQLFAPAGNMANARQGQTETLLNDGTVLITGGTDEVTIFNTGELYVASQLSGLTSIAVAPDSPSIGVGGTQRFTAVGTFVDGSTEILASVLWSSSNTGIAAVTNDGTNYGFASSLTQGSATITASALGITGSTSLTITAPSLVSIQLSPQSLTIPLGATQQFAAIGVYSDGSTQDLSSTSTWSTSAPAIATINSSGLVTGLHQGVTTIQVSFGSVNATTNLSVASAALSSISIIPASGTIPVGTSQQYQAVDTYTDGSAHDVSQLVSWASTAPAVATISSTGIARGVGQGTTTVSASFESISASVQVTVGPPSLVSLVITPNAGSLSSGATLQLTATGNYSDGSSQNLTSASSWATSSPGVLSVSSAGLVTAVAAGNATVTATSGSSSGTTALIVASGTGQANLNTSRYLHSSITLETGQILVAGGVSCPSPGSCTYLNSAEIYDPGSSTFSNTGAMAQARSAPAVLLNNGSVLIAGGYDCDTSGNCSSLSSAEIYNPNTGAFVSAGNLTTPRSGHTMTLLGNGTVLIAGGQNCTTRTSCTALATGEIYDPAAGTFLLLGSSMTAARFGASAVLLNSGQVLIAGGFDGANLPAPVEIFGLTTGGFASNGPSLNTPRFNATATLLNSGQVLVAGGSTCNLPGCPTNAAEIYDPATNTVSAVAGGMQVSRFSHTATLLTNGQVVLAGGFSSCNSSCTSESSTELFDPVAISFTSSQALTNALAGQTGTMTANGNALLIGGINAGATLASDEWYQPASLTPPGLVSISLTPANLSLAPGQSQQIIATGTLSDGSTQKMQSVIWTSSNPSAALVSNSQGSAVLVNAQATGMTTITATAGNIGGSASLNVAGLVSLTLAPTNPSLMVGKAQQFTATATLSDGSTQDVTTSTVWTSSDNSVLVLGGSNLQGYGYGVAAGTATITATLGSIQASTSVSVQPPVAAIAPSITSVSPTGGAAGTQVLVVGSGFGSTQGSGIVWLGSTYGIVNSWSDTQIGVTVAPIAQSGTVLVRQSGLSSNAIPFSVNTATISAVSPSSAAPGAAVTISGSGFGSVQGSGQVFLGTANALVGSWSDSQIIATVASGSRSGSARVLQNGVMSNAVSFTVTVPHITSVSPNSGGPGTAVTITGGGFGASQETGIVWLGSANGEVMSWSDTQIMAVITANAVTGVARVEQNGIWSNSVPLTVNSGGVSTTVVPNLMNLLVGQTHAIQALNAAGQQVNGLTWTSSDPTIVSLSTDDPPVLTALAAGHVSIVAGDASADVTVYAGALPLGTTVWSNPGNGAGVMNIVPAIPSPTGVADVFALNGDCNVQAITSDGTVAWTANIGQPPQYSGNLDQCNPFMPDFQGGIVVQTETSRQQLDGSSVFTYHVQKFDGVTGQAYPEVGVDSQHWANINQAPGDTFYGLTYHPTVVHPDGTVFSLGNGPEDLYGFPIGAGTVYAIDPVTGQGKGSITLAQQAFWGDLPLVTSAFGDLIVAGDGYAYVPYVYNDNSVESFGTINGVSGCWRAYPLGKTHFGLVRMDTAGNSSLIELGQWVTYTEPNCDGVNIWVSAAHVITNADQGALVSWQLNTNTWSGGGATLTTSSEYHITTTSGTSMASDVIADDLIIPVLQGQDGTFYGTGSQRNLVHLDQSGHMLWSVPGGYTPRIATADGGLIAGNARFDSSGKVVEAGPGTESRAAYSWRDNSYGIFSGVDLLALPAIDWASGFEAFQDGNPSTQATSVNACAALDKATQNTLTNAYTTLRDFLANARQCPACDSKIFAPLKVVRSDFVTYLKQTPRFCDGMKSQEPGKTLGLDNPTVADYFQKQHNLGAGLTARTALNGPSKPLWIFVDPSQINNDPSRVDRHYYPAMIFHEGLHGYTQLGDGDPFRHDGLCQILKVDQVANYSNCAMQTIDITTWIEDYVMFPSN